MRIKIVDVEEVNSVTTYDVTLQIDGTNSSLTADIDQANMGSENDRDLTIYPDDEVLSTLIDLMNEEEYDYFEKSIIKIIVSLEIS